MQGDVVCIELDQRLPRGHLLALLDQRREALAAQIYRIQTDMQQHLHTVGRRDADGVAGVLQVADHPGQRRTEHLRCRVDTQAVANQATGKHRVGHVIQRHQHTGQRCQQFHLWGCDHDFTCS